MEKANRKPPDLIYYTSGISEKPTKLFIFEALRKTLQPSQKSLQAGALESIEILIFEKEA
jgi:hypothetical protein